MNTRRPPAPINPFMPDLQDRLDEMLPAGHPSVEQPMLSPMQAQALPTLLWFFDQMRARGTGKSYTMAVVLIELAKRGYRVGIIDPSQTLVDSSYPNRQRSNRYMAGLVTRVFTEHYPRDIFHVIRKGDEYELIYVGRRPR